MAATPAKKMRSIRAIIFDLDDTLVESTVNYAKFKTLVIERITSHGEPKDLYDPHETIVMIIARYEERMRSAGIPEVTIRNRLEELNTIMDEVELERVSETKPMRGATGLLKLLRKNGIKVGILTRGCEEYTRSALARTGMLELVDGIECRNANTKPKPDPEAYLKLALRLGVRKEETLFVGDHLIDAQCAANAGVPFVAVETGDVPEEDLRKAGCIELFHDVGDMAAWLERILSSP
jgi:HAD superfamily hydrolase (TIGR01549 family)